jgi:hypothetical protein
MVNPFLVLATEAYNRTNNLNGILTGTIKVPWVKGLSYTANYSKTLNYKRDRVLFMLKILMWASLQKVRVPGIIAGQLLHLFDNIIKYNRTFAGVHNVDLTLLHSNQKYEGYGQGASATGFDNDQLGTYRLSAGAIQAVSTSGAEDESVGQMARLTYTYNDKYSLTGTIVTMVIPLFQPITNTVIFLL